MRLTNGLGRASAVPLTCESSVPLWALLPRLPEPLDDEGGAKGSTENNSSDP